MTISKESASVFKSTHQKKEKKKKSIHQKELS